MTLTIELGPHTRKLLRELCGKEENDLVDITHALRLAFEKMSSEERAEFELRWEEAFRESFKNNGDTPEAAEATPAPAAPEEPAEPEPQEHKTPKEIFTAPERTEPPREPSLMSKDREEQIAALERLREKAAAEAEARAAEKGEALPLCGCGCGRQVRKPSHKYLKGHSGGKRPAKPKPKGLKLTKEDLQAVDGHVICPETGESKDIDACMSCAGCVTRLRDPTTGIRYVRCLKVKEE